MHRILSVITVQTVWTYRNMNNQEMKKLVELMGQSIIEKIRIEIKENNKIIVQEITEALSKILDR